MHTSTTHNVEGVERSVSVIGGLALIGCGIRHGGVIGILEIGAGGMALLRGITGHCVLKEKLCAQHEHPHNDIARYSHMPLDSEVRSPDFRNPETGLPDSTPMGHEREPDNP